MNSLPFLLAWRYIMKTKQERSIDTMIKICFIGIALGTFSLALVLAIMRGFEQATHDHLQGIHAHVIMQSYTQQPLDIEAITHVLHKEFPAVVGISPSYHNYALIQDDRGNLRDLVTLKGIDPLAEKETTSLATKLITKKSLEEIISNNSVAVGYKLAHRLQVSEGNQFQIHFAHDSEEWSPTIHLDTTNLMVGGIFKTGIEEFDASLIVGSFELMEELFSTAQPTAIQLKLAQDIDEKKYAQQLRHRFDLDCYAWQELYPALLAAMALEKYASFLVLTLLMLVASMSIISLLFMQIMQKKHDIAILQTLGAPFREIKKIFFIIGAGLSCCACICGLLIAFCVGFILKNFISIQLPDAYFASHLPVTLEGFYFLMVFCVVMLLSCGATLLSLRKLNEMTIAASLKT